MTSCAPGTGDHPFQASCEPQHSDPSRISFRPFKNTDPPHLARIWRNQPPARGRAQPVSSTMLEEFVLSKPYFDQQGLIVAVDEGQPVGYVHAGFGPSEDLSRLERTQGVLSALLVHAHPCAAEIADDLLARGEAYLRAAGSTHVVAGGVDRCCPYYLGLQGGSGLPGVLDSDAAALDLFHRHGYVGVDRVAVFHRELGCFRPPMDRVQLQIRRNTRLEVIEDPPARNWWEACTLGCFEQMEVRLWPRDNVAPWAAARFWNLGPLALTWGVQGLGLTDIEVVVAQHRKGVATFLLGEAMRLLQERGATLIEAQTMPANVAVTALLHRLGFVQIDAGSVLRKELGG